MDNKKIILIFVKNLTRGGAEKQSIILAKTLSAIYKVHYIIFNAKFQDPGYLEMLREAPSVTVTAFRGNIISRFFSLAKFLNFNRRCIIFSYLTAANLIAAFAGRLCGVKCLFIGIRNAYLPPCKAVIDRLLCNHFANCTIVNSYSGERHFINTGFDEKKIIVIPNCYAEIDQDNFRLVNASQVSIITVGRFVPQKDYETALKAISVLKKNSLMSFRYIIAGFGELESKIRSQIAEMDLSDTVTIIIQPNNIAELLLNADIYLSTSLFEGTSNSIMEAMNANLPIVATNVGDNACLVKHGENGYLTTPKNFDQTAQALSTLINDTTLRIAYGKKSKERLINNYSVTVFRKQYMQLIDDCSI